MPLESATYIDDLNTANPAPTDLLGQGDDHIRLIKAVLKATFPNITGAVDASHTDLNDLLDLFSAGGGLVPVGAVTAWYGSSVSVPTGWHVCDGSTVPRSDGAGNITVPDLRDRVVLGAGTVAAQGATHGAANQSATTGAGGAHSHTITADGGHTHTGATIGGTALSVSQLPSHRHLNGVADGSPGPAFTRGTGPSAGGSQTIQTDSTTPAVEGYSESVGSGATHTHSISFSGADGTHTHTVGDSATHTHGVTVAVYQPALALHYIMKV